MGRNKEKSAAYAHNGKKMLNLQEILGTRDLIFT